VKDKTLYVVSGFMRTGTSMMMKALEAGGLEAVYQQSRDEMKQRFADEFYDPNIGGLYELERKDYLQPEFPRQYEGKLIKVLNMEYAQPNGVVKSMVIMPHDIRVVFMTRDSEEIRQSYDAFFNQQLPEEQIKTFKERWEGCIERINNRKDVLSLDVFNFRDVVENPQKHFQILKDHEWKIDVNKATAMVDPKYYRFRRENLTIGVL